MTDDELLDHVAQTCSDLPRRCAATLPQVEASLNVVASAVAKSRRLRAKEQTPPQSAPDTRAKARVSERRRWLKVL